MTLMFPCLTGDPLEWKAFFSMLTLSILHDIAPLIISTASTGSTTYVANGIVKWVPQVPSSASSPVPVSDPVECGMHFVRLPPPS